MNDNAITEDNPKYLLPGTRERVGKRIEFRKSVFVYTPGVGMKPIPAFPRGYIGTSCSR